MAAINISANRSPVGGKLKGSQHPVKTINGSGFGGAPNIVFFDRVDSHDSQYWNAKTPVIGEWAAGTNYKYMQHDGRSWIPLRDPENISSASANKFYGRFNIGVDVGELFICYRMVADPALIFPHAQGANQPLDIPNSLPYKPLWLSDQGNTDTPDQVLPNYNASGWGVFGNTCIPKSYTPLLYSISWPNALYFDTSGESTVWGFYQGADNGTSSNFEYLRSDSVGTTIAAYVGDLYHPSGATPTKRFYDGEVAVNAQLTAPVTGYVNVQCGQADYYAATGSNCRASVWASDSPTWGGQTKAYIIPADVWTDTQIKFSPHPREAVLGYYHVRLGDGTIIQNVTVV
mgnify:FL=1